MIKRGVNVSELPSFNSIKDVCLRSQNRGAILANIYEAYRGSDRDLLHKLDTYIHTFSDKGREAAEGYMLIHLKQRGYAIGS